MTPDMTIQPGAKPSDSLEDALRDLLAFAPPDHLQARLDGRVSIALAAAAATKGSRRRRLTVRRRTMLGLLAAAAILTAATGALALYEGMGAGMDDGFGLQLDRSVPVGATEVHDGYRVTIDRAYIDGERLWLAIRADDERKRPEVTQLMSMYAVVTDQDGTWGGGGFATSRPLGQWSSINAVWATAPVTPLPAGPRDLHVVVPHIFHQDPSVTAPPDETDWNPLIRVDGPWTFDITLKVDHGGVIAEPGTVETIAGVSMTLDQVVIGPSAIRVQVGIDDPKGADWMILGEARHNGQAYPVVVSSVGGDGTIQMQTDGGTDDPYGAWTFVVKEVTHQGPGDAPEVRTTGPWTFDFVVP
jgi:hypothetical protein